MSFENIKPISSFKELDTINKDYIILFIHWESCGACKHAKPIITKINNELITPETNCLIVRVNIENIDKNDVKLKNMYNGAVPAFRLLKKQKNGNYEDLGEDIDVNQKKYKIGLIEGLSNGNKGSLSTYDVIKNWISNPPKSKNSIEKYSKNLKQDNIHDDYETLKFKNNRNSISKITNSVLRNIL